MLSIITMSGIDIAISILNLLGCLLAFLDGLAKKFFVASVFDFLLANAKATHPLLSSETSIVDPPQTTAHIESAESNVRTPQSPSLVPEVTETKSLGSMIESNTPELFTNAALVSTNIAQADSVNLDAVSCKLETELDDPHTDTRGMQSNNTAPRSICFDDTAPSMSNTQAAHVDIMSDDMQTSKDGDTQTSPCLASDHPKMPECSVDRNETISLSPVASFAPHTSDEDVTDAPGASNYMALPIRSPSPEVMDEPVAIDTRFDETSTESPKSTVQVQVDHNLDAITELDTSELDTSEPDTSELDVRRASVSDYSPKSIASTTATTVASASSMSVPHEEGHVGLDESLEINPRSDFFFDNQSVADTQLQTPTDELAPFKLNVLSLNASIRPQYHIEWPTSKQITLEVPASSEPLDIVVAHQDVHEINQQAKVPASLSRLPLNTGSSNESAATFQPAAAASNYKCFCFTLSANRNGNLCAAAPSEAMAQQDRAGQAPSENAYPCAIFQDGEERRVHTYKPNTHTIAALIAEEGSMIQNEPNHCSTDSDPDVIDTSFIPQAVQQHAESQKKTREAGHQGSGRRGKKSKKSKKNTGRLNKERACVEKVLQSASYEEVDTQKTLDKTEKQVEEMNLPKDVREKDVASKKASKKNEKRRLRRQQISRDTQVEQPVPSSGTPVDEQTPQKQGVTSRETTGLQGTEIEGHWRPGTTSFPKTPSAPSDECTETKLDTKSLEDGTMMGCTIATSEMPEIPSIVIWEAPDTHVECVISDGNTGVAHSESHMTDDNAAVAAQHVIEVDVSKATQFPHEEREPLGPKSEVSTTAHDAITDENDLGGGCHTVAAHEVVCQLVPWTKQTLSPIYETEIENTCKPEAHPAVSAARFDSRHMVTPNNTAPELAAPSSSCDTMGTSKSMSFDIEIYAHTLLTESVQQQQRSQHRVAEYTKPASYHGSMPPPPPYNNGMRPHYGPEYGLEYGPGYGPEYGPDNHHPMDPNFSCHYQHYSGHPFADQLPPEYDTPYLNCEQYTGYPQPQYYEPDYNDYESDYDEIWELYYKDYLPPHSQHHIYAKPSYDTISDEQWKLYVNPPKGQRFGNVSHASENEVKGKKPWYLETLDCEKEEEEEFQTGEPTQHERLVRTSRKWAI